MATVGGVEGQRFESFAASRKKEWEAFASSGGGPSSAPKETNGVKSSPGPSKGFDDAFAPSSGLQPSATADATLETSVELPNNASMFAELSPPVDLGKTAVTSPKPMDIDAPATDVDDERKRFEATFPDIDSDFASLVSPPSSQPAKPLFDGSVAAASPASKMPSQLTGETGAAPGPPLPRRPPAASTSPSSVPPSLPSPGAKSPPALAPKPALVSRGSQTSPRLMADWKPPAERPAQPNGQSSLRQSSIPDLDLTSPPPSATAAKPPVDLLGDDDDSNMDALAPRSLSKSPLPSATSPVPSATASSGSSGKVASKRMSFLGGQPGSPSLSSAGSVGEREKFRPTKRMSLASGGGASPLAAPVASPKSAPADADKPPAPVDEGVKAVEERFPALTLDEVPAGTKPAKEKQTWEKVVEKEEADDSSDEETAAPTPRQDSKPKAPDFGDDDFAPRHVQAASGRPKFGSAKSATSATAASPSTLTASPPSLPVSDSAVDAISPDTSTTRQTSQASFASSTSGVGGGIDLGPALASIHKFAPKGDGALSPRDEEGDGSTKSPSLPPIPSSASTTSLSRLGASTSPSLPTSPSLSSISKPTSPPIVAPKPQSSHRKAAINSLVSRYEGLGGPLTGGPPPVGVKPVGLRKDSTGSSTGSGASHALHYRDQVKPQRLPQWGAPAPSSTSGSIKSPVSVSEEKEEDEGPAPPPKPSTPTAFAPPGGTRAPFKPVPPPGSPSSQRPAFSAGHASRPSFGGGAPRPLPQSVQNSPSTAQRPPDEQEERFAGVSSMKSRWESMAKTKEADGTRPGAGKRKEHAAI